MHEGGQLGFTTDPIYAQVTDNKISEDMDKLIAKYKAKDNNTANFFGVTWSKLNYRLQTVMKSSHLHPNERVAGEEEIIVNGQIKGYAPLCPLPVIIALSFLLDIMEAHLFRKYVCERLQKPASVITPIFLLGNTNN